MSRYIVPSSVAVLLCSLSFACDKQPGVTEQQREEKANQQAAQQQGAANEQAQNAQASAEREIAAARESFEKAREDYRHSRTQDLNEIDRKMADLEAKVRTAKGKAKTDLQNTLPMIRSRREAFARDLEALDNTTAASWDQAKTNLDKEWDAFRNAVDKAP
jgi:flagellar biosynthesis/type III secretory pathway protein FliH